MMEGERMFQKVGAAWAKVLGGPSDSQKWLQQSKPGAMQERLECEGGALGDFERGPVWSAHSFSCCVGNRLQRSRAETGEQISTKAPTPDCSSPGCPPSSTHHAEGALSP